MIDLTMVFSSAIGVVLANFLMVLLAALIIAWEFRQHNKAIRQNTEAVHEHTRVYLESVGKALQGMREVKETLVDDTIKSPPYPFPQRKPGGGPKGTA
jgi:hypothetical protein